MPVKSVPDRLVGIADLYRERNKFYGDNYKQHGAMLAAMFPDGLSLKGPEDFNRFAMFLQITHKVTRYAKSIEFDQGGHQDSLDDISNYAQMMAEYDDIARELKKAPKK